MESTLERQEEVLNNTTFGFWIYLMTDCVLFGTLFATYLVLKNGIWDGPSSKEIFNVHYALAETLILLVSSYCSGIAAKAAVRQKKKPVLFWLAIVFVLGVAFITMELMEFAEFVHEGYSWSRSAFLSSFFTLVGTHGTHISFGLLWLVILFAQIALKGINHSTFRRLACFTMFWHFLDVVWIFIFTVVYLMGAI